MASNVFPVPSSAGLVAPIAGALTLQQTLTSSGAVTIPANITQVFAICVGAGSGSTAAGSYGYAGGAGGFAFGLTAPSNTVTIGANVAGNASGGGSGGASIYGSIMTSSSGAYRFDGSGVPVGPVNGQAMAGNTPGSSMGQGGVIATGAGNGAAGESSFVGAGGWQTGSGSLTGVGGNGGPNSNTYTGGAAFLSFGGGGAGYAGNGTAGISGTGGAGGLGGGGCGGQANSSNRSGAGIVYLYY
jgi:hypothetical protein